MDRPKTSQRDGLLWVGVAVGLGGIAGALYGLLVIFPAPGLSDPPLSFKWVIGGNAISGGVQALCGASLSVAASAIARELGAHLFSEVATVLVFSFVGTLMGCYLTFTFAGTPNWIALVVVAILLTLTRFGVTHLAHNRRGRAHGAQ